MSIACYDSSALVKLVVEEAGTDVAVELWDDAALVHASRLVYPEVRAALAAARRAGRLTADGERRAAAEWEGYWSGLEVIELTASVAATAAALAEEYVLSGADAVHLAGALTLGRAASVFVAWDRRLREAAIAAGLAVAPVL